VLHEKMDLKTRFKK